MKIFIACSKHFYDKVLPIKDYLESNGHEVSLPNSFDNPMMEKKLKVMGEKEHRIWKALMMRRDEKNISPQDAILVLNFEKNGLSNYIGGATFLEIYKAWELGKKIFFYNPLPSCCFTDELKGIDPIIINGNLGVI